MLRAQAINMITRFMHAFSAKIKKGLPHLKNNPEPTFLADIMAENSPALVQSKQASKQAGKQM